MDALELKDTIFQLRDSDLKKGIAWRCPLGK